jgi:hypothetical protein
MKNFQPARIPFHGETMVCLLCQKVAKSDPRIHSDWRAIQFRGQMFYACTDHFPPDGSSAELFEKAYRNFMLSAIKAKTR